MKDGFLFFQDYGHSLESYVSVVSMESCSSSRKGLQHWLREQKNEQHKQRP